MPGTSAVLQYKRQSVLTAPPVKIVAMLYEKAIQCLSQAERDIAEKRYDSVSRRIGLAQEILGELLSALDMEAGGEIAHELQRLYTFALERMMTAHIEKNGTVLRQARDVLSTLHEAWDDIARR
jgi:flagellar protein FliS